MQAGVPRSWIAATSLSENETACVCEVGDEAKVAGGIADGVIVARVRL